VLDEEDEIPTARAGELAMRGAMRSEKIRVIVMSNYLILDPEVFGPMINSWAGIILCKTSQKSETHKLSRPRGVRAGDG